MVIYNRHIFRFLVLFLLLVTTINEAWGHKVTYHILTLPMTSTRPGNTKSDYYNWRMEALRVVVDDASNVELDEHFKSPLAKNFKYYAAADVDEYGAAQAIYASNNSQYYLYKIRGEDTVSEEDNATPLPDRADIPSNDYHVYVTYEYNPDNGIAKLNGSESYNITIGDGFLAYNRGRNNRPAVIPKQYVSAEQLTNDDFVYVDVSKVSGLKDKTYWADSKNKNDRNVTQSRFFFQFKYLGEDPYNITIAVDYKHDTYYIEKDENKDIDYVRKYYKDARIFGQSTGTLFLASDFDKKYKTVYNTEDANNNPTKVEYYEMPGYHRNYKPVWNSFAMLSSHAIDGNKNGYVFMGTKTFKSDGSYEDPGKDKNNNYQYFYLKSDYKDLNYAKMTPANAVKSYSTDDKMYELASINFHVTTPFYNPSGKDVEKATHTLTATIQMSEYTMQTASISDNDIPESLKRKYCNINGYYKDAARTQAITKYSDLGESRDIYLGYEVLPDIPFKTVAPADTTWYELTDEGSTQIEGKKIKYDGSANFKNNGPDGEYLKTSEFAFLGDPYELYVISRSQTWAAGTGNVSYVGVTGDTPSSGTKLTTNTTATAGYKWQIPVDGTSNTDKNFPLQLYKGEGHWSWEANHISEAVTYGTNKTIYITNGNAQTITLNISGLTYVEGYCVKISTKSGDTGQVDSTTPTLSEGTAAVQPDCTATVTVTVKASGGSAKSFVLTITEYNGSTPIATATDVTINQAATAYAGGDVTYSTSGKTRLKVMELPVRTYTYKIVDKAGRIAVKASASQTIYSPLSLASIPSIIVSPFLVGEELTFYDTYTDNAGRNTLANENIIKETPNTNHDIYVKYTTSTLGSKAFTLSEDQEINVKLNGEYLYCEMVNDAFVIKTKAEPTNAELSSNAYLWYLRGRDPYYMLLENKGATVAQNFSPTTESVTIYNDDGTSSETSRNKGMFVHVASWTDGADLTFSSERGTAARFIAKLGVSNGLYEVMAATGADVDASTTYYNIGRSSANTVKMYKNTTYAHNDNVLKFELEVNRLITYHLIDKANADLLQIESRSPELILPSEYQSPLVDQYHYYSSKDDAISGTSPLSSMPSGDNITIYVTYDTDEHVGFGTKSPYTLKFLNGKSYYLEDGNDKLTKTKMQAMYPYCNGDGHLNIYGEESNKEQMSGGSSTRPRWIWFFESENRDPYHVKIHSRSTISFNGDNSTYLQTYAVHFNQDADNNTTHIVTGGNLAGISQVAATEYMILGETKDGKKRYKLLTTNLIEGKRQYVRSFEQYWKTYNMIKQHVLGINVKEGEDKDEFDENPETFVMPQSKWSELKTKLGSGEGNLGINDSEDLNYVDNCSWHSYSVVANALRWNGFDDKGKASKKVEELEHWFQTFDMGDGTFEIESADIPPVLVLLDRHGWEIMRKTLPTGADPEKIAALKAYDSPLVKEYKFYSNATKASGCHKYTLRLNDKNEERDQIKKEDGKHFTSASLGTLPTLTADKYGTYSDVYVTYTVKDEYEKSYSYDYNTSTKEETSNPSKFLVVLNGRYARNLINERNNYFSKPIYQATSPIGGNVYDMILNPSQQPYGNVTVDSNKDGKIDENNLWYVQPNLEIDEEMGIPWATAEGSSSEPYTKNETKAKYKDKTGFDPYNIQLKNVQTNDFFTIDLTSTKLENGVWEGTIGPSGVTLAAQTTAGYVQPEGYDHTTLKITKQTFMAVSDANGNMQLMPRFDHTKRVDIATASPYLTTLQEPVDHTKAVVTDNTSMGPQTVFFVRPQTFEYRIIDHDGNEALRYKSAGEYSPSIPDKIKSPLATDFKYYYGNTEKEISAGAYAAQWAEAEETYKRTALTEELVAQQANLLPVTGDYYYRIGTNPASYTYKKVTVTKVKEITNLFAEAGLDGDNETIYVRYSYNESADDDGNGILQGKWFTINLAGKDVQSTETTINAEGNNVFLYADEAIPTKVAPINGTDEKRKWQWKFLAAPTEISSPYYRPVDPYAIQIFNRKANYSDNLDANPNPMSIGIKVGGKDRFAILSHPNGGYALAVSGLGTYSYSYLNGANMTVPASETSASIVEECFQRVVLAGTDYDNLKTTLEAGADAVYYIKVNGSEATSTPTYKKVTVTSKAVSEEIDSNPEDWEKAYISPGARLILNDDVVHEYQYNVITNDDSGNKCAISGTQDDDEAKLRDYEPYLPETMQSPLLNEDDYLYYGSATESAGTYTVAPNTKLITLYGLYDDVVYVRYNSYSMDKTNYNVPNKKDVVAGKVAKDPTSQDVAININDGLPYNIIWEDDNMMKANNGAIECTASQDLSGDVNYTWQFAGNDPYALQIKNKGGKFINNSSNKICTLENTATPFMLLNKDGYDYGVLQKTGDASANMLTFGDHDSNGGTAETLYLSTSNPKYFIIFGLSTHKLLYHLIINTTKEITPIPYRAGNEKTYDGTVAWAETDTIHIKGTTQRDLISMSYGVPGDKYQLGSTIMGQTYCVDAGEVSIGDVLKVPNEFNRPNCNFFFYIDNIQKGGDAKYKKGSEDDITTEETMKSSADALTETGDYYYKITGGTIYRKVHVTTAADGVNNAVYEISGSTKAAYDAAATSTTFQRTAASVDAMKTDAATIAILGDHYYKINDGASYYKVSKYPIAVDDDADFTIKVCTETDWTNAAATKETKVANEEAMITEANALTTVGDHYYEIGDIVLYKKVTVTTAKVESTPAVYTVVDCTEDDWTNAWQDYDDINNKYKGLKLPVQSPRLMSDAGLIGCLVKVNVAYAFQTGLETNAGEGFVTSVDQNLWYTFETYDKEEKKSYLAHYTNAWGLQAMEGRETHYTNDYLWTPLGDVYGFRMYNRYMIKNSGGVNNVMTMPTMTEGTNLKLAVPSVDGIPEGYEVFELLLSNTSGSFRIHPVINNSGTQYYIWKDPADDYAKISTNYSEWTFALGTELLKPYIDRVGYVGGLTKTAYNTNKTVLDKVMDGTASYEDMLEVQGIVYKDANIVPYTPGYYRLHSQPGVSGMNTVRYASGYLHSVEKGSGPSTAIPLHFYSRIGTNTTFETLENGFTYTNATRGPIPVPATEYDPSTIFYFGGTETLDGNPSSTMQTQGLYVAANPNGDTTGENNEKDGKGTNRLQRAVMSDNSANAITFSLMDIGGAVLLIHDGAAPAQRRYLNFDQSNFFQRTATDVPDMNAKAAQLTSKGTYYFKIGSSTYKKVTVTTPKTGDAPATCDPASNGAESNETNWERAADIYDLKYYHDSPTDDAKWCMAPADSLLVETHSGGDGYFYSTFCAPYDMKLPENKENDTTYYAYICTEWNTKSIHPVKTGGGGKEIPAGTPVIIRTKDTSGSVKLTFPTTSLSSAGTNIFTGKYLEQLLATEITAEDKVYSFGLPITGYGIVTTSGATNGDITDVINKSQDYTGVGFYINANPNKELSEETGQWYPNNRYVLHNKIYYRAGETPSASAPSNRAIEFVPVIFDDEEQEELNPDGTHEVIGDGCVYDLMGRKVATREQVEDGSWKQRVATGIYIINGKKIRR